MGQGHNRTNRKLPFKAQPDIKQDRNNRQTNGDKRGLDQFTRHLWPDRFDRRERDARRDRPQRGLDGGHGLHAHAFLAVLRLDADHRDVLVIPEGRIKNFRD